MDIDKYLAEREKAYKNFIKTVMSATPFRQLDVLCRHITDWIDERVNKGD